MKNWQKYIEINPLVRSRKSCVIDTRITVSDLLDSLASGMSYIEIINNFPILKEFKKLAVLSCPANRVHILNPDYAIEIYYEKK